MVPPWVPDLPGDGGEESLPTDPSTPAAPSIPIAPPRRFDSARRSIGSFASGGNGRALKRGAGQYFKKGYGGRTIAAKRLKGTAQTAGALFGALSPGAGAAKPPARDALEQACRSGATPEDIVTALVEALRPVDGSLDAEASRKSLAEALSEFLLRSPDADLLSLTDEQRMSIVARYVALDVYGRFFLDLGKTIIERAPSVVTGLSRLREAKEYIRETVASVFKKILASNASLTATSVVGIVQRALGDAIDVFQGYTT